ncbi:MAG: hypothetical protein K2X90_03920 [Candidatus Babeliaceae bacterium]|nr:hypothetical protein [Candidatus Babeliaceae bacterium]
MENLIKLIDQIKNKPIYDKITLQFPSLIKENENHRIKNLIVPNLRLIEEEINLLLSFKIRNCNNLQEAKKYFDILQKIQEVLAMLFFKEKIEISNKLQKFIRDFERLDDGWLRENLFNEIKQGSYNYNFMEP